LFKATGCEGCHVQTLASAKGIYSDLLLHDMGTRLADGAGTYETRGNQELMTSKEADDGAPPASAAVAADAKEWRTPPLWGVRDSGPYLHDGRAGTLDEAVRLHEGEAADSVKKYNALQMTDQQAIMSFLESLAAPSGA
jgi:CxxC motif-containing protein (DUF1111 family)